MMYPGMLNIPLIEKLKAIIAGAGDKIAGADCGFAMSPLFRFPIPRS
jgi:hypothetical protein